MKPSQKPCTVSVAGWCGRFARYASTLTHAACGSCTDSTARINVFITEQRPLACTALRFSYHVGVVLDEHLCITGLLLKRPCVCSVLCRTLNDWLHVCDTASIVLGHPLNTPIFPPFGSVFSSHANAMRHLLCGCFNPGLVRVREERGPGLRLAIFRATCEGVCMQDAPH